MIFKDSGYVLYVYTCGCLGGKESFANLLLKMRFMRCNIMLTVI